jgi:hypothetical protein
LDPRRTGALDLSHTVYVLDGATCGAVDHAGCGQKPATITVGDDPPVPAVDLGTDTAYISNHAKGDHTATVAGLAERTARDGWGGA